MSHTDQRVWCEAIKVVFPEYFRNTNVLDVGSADLNGSNKYLFDECRYKGIDILPWKNVDIIDTMHKHDFKGERFNVVVSTNAFEHDKYCKKTLKRMTEVLKPKGLMFFTACHSHQEHGTLKNKPDDSLTTQSDDVEWQNYYKSIKVQDILFILKDFSSYYFDIYLHDLRLFGIKKG